MTHLVKRFVAPYISLILIVVVCLVLQVMAGLQLPSIMARLVDVGVKEGDLAYIKQGGLTMIGWTVFALVSSLVLMYCSSRVATSVARDIRSALFSGVLSFSIPMSQGLSTPALITRATNDVSQIEDLLRMSIGLALADRFICALPFGYETKIGEEGTNVSIGERQLITIARAFMADPDILILDEVTSGVDTLTERLVTQAAQNVIAGRTSIVIAHRLSTVMNADMIVVMERGILVEKGTHSELMEQNGVYARMVQSQKGLA